MNCGKTALLLSAYIDGEMSAEEKARVEAHLGECGECRAKLERLKRTDGFLSLDGEEGALPFFETRLLARISRRENRAHPLLKLAGIQKKLTLAFFALLLILSAVAYNRHVTDPVVVYTELQSYVAGNTTFSAAAHIALSNEMTSYLVND